ncbi:hypothetical protein D3C79_940970 [compost metagenome]
MNKPLHRKIVADHTTRLIDRCTVQLERKGDLLDGVQSLGIGRPSIDTGNGSLGYTGVIDGKAQDPAVAQAQVSGRRLARAIQP